MSFDDNKLNETEATEEQVKNTPEPSEKLTDLEKELFADMESSVDNMTFTATLHFEFSDIFNAIEHIETEPDSEAEAEEPEIAEEPVPEESEPSEEPEAVSEPEDSEPEESEPENETQETEDDIAEAQADEEAFEEPEIVEEPETPQEIEKSETPEEVPEVTEDPETSAAPEAPAKTHENLITKYKHQDKKTKKLVLTDIILFAVIIASIIGGLVAANSLVDKANAANDAKIAEKQANVEEVDLAENIYDLAADQVIEDIAVPTYTLDQLYALDLRKPTGFTVKDLELITRRGLVGCEEAFVKAEETYGVNCIFLMSIASLESAYGTQMFRPNNMFGYGRSGFSSKQEGIMTVAKGLGTRYLNPGGSLYGGSPTLKGVNKRYAANPQWYYKVGKYMKGYYAELAAAKNGALDKFE